MNYLNEWMGDITKEHKEMYMLLKALAEWLDDDYRCPVCYHIGFKDDPNSDKRHGKDCVLAQAITWLKEHQLYAEDTHE